MKFPGNKSSAKGSRNTHGLSLVSVRYRGRQNQLTEREVKSFDFPGWNFPGTFFENN